MAWPVQRMAVAAGGGRSMALNSNWLDVWLAQDEDTFPWDRHDAADLWQWSHHVADLDDDDGDDDGDYDDDDPHPSPLW